jgi:hypothetical protein
MLYLSWCNCAGRRSMIDASAWPPATLFPIKSNVNDQWLFGALKTSWAANLGPNGEKGKGRLRGCSKVLPAHPKPESLA